MRRTVRAFPTLEVVVIVRGVSVVISLLFSALFGIFCLILFVESLISVITGDTSLLLSSSE